MDRAKSLDLAISQLEKTFGKGTVMRLGSREKLAVDTVPTGSLALDLVLVGFFLKRLRLTWNSDIHGRWRYLLVASLVAVDLVLRRHQRALLRC